jgi:hypothetical protein
MQPATISTVQVNFKEEAKNHLTVTIQTVRKKCETPKTSYL